MSGFSFHKWNREHKFPEPGQQAFGWYGGSFAGPRGAEAYEAGRRIEENPYLGEPSRSEWFDGWDFARIDARAEMAEKDAGMDSPAGWSGVSLGDL